ncbi:MAG: methylenetetrahydrofolate--tRNA-(uracil(54)-C(5))-methyltransferase (FADH(2)-oxidizing) TrmFO [Clostridiales bacterium]|nr:methylenetetrahydrofolate--tRNA-(uracil(54)-C(5))-methyltransferase (FADH(2)-oxidizing) TrmFO [Clostridiales bacterium]
MGNGKADVTVIGAGLAGCEAAYRIAESGFSVRLIDGKPHALSPAHHSGLFAELVCSNSLKSDEAGTSGGLLKAELRELDCLLLSVAEKVRVPAGGALAVDREKFACGVTQAIRNHSRIRIEEQTVADFNDDELTVVATGPLTQGGMNEALLRRLGRSLGFYDAAAPVIDAESIDGEYCFTASRYGKGTDDYVNCPMTKEEYDIFVRELVGAERAQLHDFDKREIFEGCMPVEIMAERGADTLRFGPLRPVGFTDPRTGKRPYAVVQLRAENTEKTMYNIVGFQTNLKFGEQKRVFSLIPALRNATFLRYGVMHRNTYIDAPRELDASSRLRRYPNTFIAGQLSGVEGYVESIASGLVCGMNAVRLLQGKSALSFPAETMIGALLRFITSPNDNFQPMNANFGILPPLSEHVRDKSKRKIAYCERSLSKLREFKAANGFI